MAGPFPDAHPDEILYSLTGRHSDRMRYPNKLTFIERLFGYRGPIPSIDLPSRLGHLVAYLFEEYDYSVAQVIDQHTLLPYYGAFLPPDKLNLVRQSMEAGDNQRATAYAGLGTSRIKAPECLRYCPVCVQEERKEFGECYWHRLHQLPGVEVCPRHEVWLERSDVLVRRQTYQYEFLSAEKRVPVTSPRVLDLTDVHHQDLLYLAKESEWLLQQRGFSCNLESLHKQYIVALTKRGLAAFQGTVVYKTEFFRQFRERYSQDFLELIQCDFDETSLQNWLHRLSYSARLVFYPLYHLLLIRFLGYTLDEFLHLPTELHLFGEGPWPCLNPVCKHYLQPKIEHVEISYESRGPLGEFACECGFVYFRTGPDQSPEDRFQRSSRIKAFGPVWQDALKQMMKESNKSLNQMAARLGVHVSTLRVQATKLGLIPGKERDLDQASIKQEKIRQKELAFQQKVTAYQAEWLSALRTSPPQAGSGEIIASNKRVYTWLKRNTPEWLKLKGHMPLHKQRKNWFVDWKSRDEQLAEEISKSAARLRNLSGRPIQITVAAIARDIGEPYLLHSQQDKLPQSMEVLRQVIETNEAYALRRIEWAANRYLEEHVQPTYWQLIKRAGVSTIRNNPEVKKMLDEMLLRLRL